LSDGRAAPVGTRGGSAGGETQTAMLRARPTGPSGV